MRYATARAIIKMMKAAMRVSMMLWNSPFVEVFKTFTKDRKES
jgi:hypothetical protein